MDCEYPINQKIKTQNIEKIKQNTIIQNNFINCLLRIENGFKEEMNNRGFSVEQVTIGEGYNDIKGILKKHFPLLKNSYLLNGYTGYSDADSQYLIQFPTKKLR